MQPTLDEQMQDPHFRATYFQVLWVQAQIALETACADAGSVQLGMEDLATKVSYYLERAKSSKQFDRLLQGESLEPPATLLEWLVQKARDSDETYSVSRPEIAEPQ